LIPFSVYAAAFTACQTSTVFAPLPGALSAQIVSALGAVAAETRHPLDFPTVIHYPAAAAAGYSHRETSL
jgi:hypothetical protein